MRDASPKNRTGLHAIMITLILSATICCIYLCGEGQRNTQAFDSIGNERRGLHSGLHTSNIASTLAVSASTISADHSKGSSLAMAAAREILTTTGGLMNPLVQTVLLDLTILVILLFLLHSIVLHPLHQLHIVLPDAEGDPTGSSHRQR